MAELTDQYMRYVDLVRESDLELAAAYLVMSATLMQIKSRLLLPSVRTAEGTEPEDPRAELMRRLEEYERIRSAALKLQAMPRIDRDFRVAEAERCVPVVALQPDVTPEMLASAWAAVAARLKLRDRHKEQAGAFGEGAHDGPSEAPADGALRDAGGALERHPRPRDDDRVVPGAPLACQGGNDHPHSGSALRAALRHAARGCGHA